MNKNLVFGIIIVVGFIGGIYLITQMDKDYRWQKTLNTFDDEPYNVTVLHDVLEGDNLIDNHVPLYDCLHNYKGNNNCYFLIARGCYLSDVEEVDSLLSFVKRGNKAFLAIDDITDFTGSNYSNDTEVPVYDEAEAEKESEAREVIEEVETASATEQNSEAEKQEQEQEQEQEGESSAENEDIKSWEQDLEEEVEENQEPLYYNDGENVHEYDSESGTIKGEDSEHENKEEAHLAGEDTIYDIDEFTTDYTTEEEPQEVDKEVEGDQEEEARSVPYVNYFFPVADTLQLKFGKFRTDSVQASINVNPNNVLDFTAKSVRNEAGERALKPQLEDYFYLEKSPQAVGLGKVDGHTNFIAVPYGKGTIYIHTNPVLLTNYVMIQDSGMKYVEDVFSVLSENDTIIWDHLNTKSHGHKRDYQGSGDHEIQGPFSFIFGNRSLKFSWYSILILTALFLIFYARRVQRSVPIIAPKKNNSVAFAKTIGMLYLQGNHHNYIVKYQMKYLLLFIKNKYRIQLKDDLIGFITDLTYRSDVPEEVLSKMFSKYDSMKNRSSLTDNELLTFNTQINYFYSNCK